MVVQLKTQKHETIQQDGELHQPSGEAEARGTAGNLHFEAGTGGKASQEALGTHADPAARTLIQLPLPL